jgi:hypothetical protein
MLTPLLLGWLLAAAPEAATLDRPVAVVTGVKGDVRVEEHGDKRHLELGDNLYEGAVVQLEAGEGVTLLYRDGELVKVRGSMHTTVPVHDKAYRGQGAQGVSMPPDAVSSNGGIFETRSRGVDTAEIRVEGLRGLNDDPFDLAAAPRECAVMADRATLHWHAASAEATYAITILRDDGAVDSELRVAGDRTTVRNLQPGKRYTWRVCPDGHEAADYTESAFWTLPATETATVHQAARALRQNFGAEPETRDLMLALLYKHHALYGDAIELFSGLTRAHGTNAYLHQELAWLYYHTGRLALARSELQLSKKTAP